MIVWQKNFDCMVDWWLIVIGWSVKLPQIDRQEEKSFVVRCNKDVHGGSVLIKARDVPDGGLDVDGWVESWCATSSVGCYAWRWWNPNPNAIKRQLMQQVCLLHHRLIWVGSWENMQACGSISMPACQVAKRTRLARRQTALCSGYLEDLLRCLSKFYLRLRGVWEWCRQLWTSKAE